MPVSVRHALALVRTCAVALLLIATACESAEDRLAGTYVRTFKEGITPDAGVDGEPERHALILHADGTWTSEHPAESLQQFDVPMTRGRWSVNGVTLTVGPTELGPMQYTVNGDTLFPRAPRGARMAEMMTGQSMKIGIDTYLVRER
jgi:hypothetical protein